MTETDSPTMAIFSTSDLVICALIFMGFVGAAAWLFSTADRYEKEQRRRAEGWHHDYFRGGGLVRSLMARWSSRPRLQDRSDKRSE